MDNLRAHVSLAVAWLGTLFVWAGTLFVWIGQHFGIVINTAVGLAAIAASIYSALSSRAKKKFYEKESALLDKTKVIPE